MSPAATEVLAVRSGTEKGRMLLSFCLGGPLGVPQRKKVQSGTSCSGLLGAASALTAARACRPWTPRGGRARGILPGPGGARTPPPTVKRIARECAYSTIPVKYRREGHAWADGGRIWRRRGVHDVDRTLRVLDAPRAKFGVKIRIQGDEEASGDEEAGSGVGRAGRL